MNNRYAIWLVILCLGLSGCAMEQTHFYTLHATTATPAAPGSYPHTLGVGPVFLPEAMNQPGVVSYTAGQEVNVATYHVWAGYLKDAVTRVLADNLSILLGADGVWPFPWDNRTRPVRQLRIVVEEMGGERGKTLTLQAKWTLVANNGETLMTSQRTRLQAVPADASYEAYIKTLNQLLNQLSEQMAITLKSLN